MASPTDKDRMEDDFQYYMTHREDFLLNILKPKANKRKKLLLTERSNNINCCGIINEGATCYLNSLIQFLYRLNELKHILYSIPHTSTVGAALTKVFSKLQLALSSAVDTSELIKSFGWNSHQVYEQHDAHEFFALLMSILTEDKLLKSPLENLFQGSYDDIICCPDCKYRKVNKNEYLTLCLDIPTAGSATTSTTSTTTATTNTAAAIDEKVPLEDMIKSSVESTVLDDDNKWLCSNCNKYVNATMKQEYTSIPDVIIIHLKRFRYNKSSNKREKITTNVKIPASMDIVKLLNIPETTTVNSSSSSSSSSSGSSGSGEYTLIGSILHHGTSMGGHYQCITNSDDAASSNHWYLYNDESVTLLNQSEVLSTGSNPTGYNQILGQQSYLLMYKRSSSSSSDGKDAVCMPCEHLQHEMEECNRIFLHNVRLYNIHLNTIECSIYIQPSPIESTVASDNVLVATIVLPTTITFADAQDKIHDHIAAMKSNTLIQQILGDDSIRYRLRLYNQFVKSATFGNRMSSVLQEVLSNACKCNDKCMLLLETVVVADVDADADAFIEYDEDQYVVRLLPIDALLDTDQVQVNEVAVGNDGIVFYIPSSSIDTADLLQAVRTHLHCNNCSVYSIIGRSQLVHIVDDISSIAAKAAFKRETMNAIYYERMNNVSYSSSSSSVYDDVVAKLNNITIYYNNPCTTGATVPSSSSSSNSSGYKGDEYDQSIEISALTSISACKDMIGNAIGVEPSMFQLCLPSSVEIRDLERSLKDYKLVNNSILHVTIAALCPNDHMTYQLAIDVPTDAISVKYSVDVILHEDTTCATLKTYIINNWDAVTSSSSSTNRPTNSNYVRIKCVPNSSSSATHSVIVRDDKVIKSIAKSVGNTVKVSVLILPSEEIIKDTDLAIILKLVNYNKRQLSTNRDVVLCGNSTIHDLFQVIRTILIKKNSSIRRTYSIFKYYSTRPITFDSVTNGQFISEDQQQTDAMSNSIQSKPLLVKEGSVIIVRVNEEYDAYINSKATITATVHAIDDKLPQISPSFSARRKENALLLRPPGPIPTANIQ